MTAQTFSTNEQSLLTVFQEFLVGPGQMLCFYGPVLDKHRESLRRLTDRGLLVKEQFKGGYSLTSQGFAAVRSVDD